MLGQLKLYSLEIFRGLKDQGGVWKSGRRVQMVEYLPSVCKILGSSPTQHKADMMALPVVTALGR